MENNMQAEQPVKKVKEVKRNSRIIKASNKTNPKKESIEENVEVNGEIWKQRLLKVNESKMVLKYNPLGDTKVGSHEYLFEPTKIKLEKGLILNPDPKDGEVFGSKDDTKEQQQEKLQEQQQEESVTTISETSEQLKEGEVITTVTETLEQPKIEEVAPVISETTEQTKEGEVVTTVSEIPKQEKKEEKKPEDYVRFLSMSGKAAVQIPGLEMQMIDLLSTCIVLAKEGEGEVFLLFGEPVVSGLEGDDKYKLKLNNGKYVKTEESANGTMYFQGSDLYYKDNLLLENMMLKCDQKGLHMDTAKDLTLDQSKLDDEAWEEFERGDRIFLSFGEDGPKIESFGERDEELKYETQDGRAEVLNAKYDSTKNSTTGDLVLHDFLLRYVSPKEQLIVGKKVEAEDKRIKGVTITFSGEGDKLINVEQKKEHKLELEVEPEGEFKGVTVKVPLVLENIGIKDGNLVIGDARVDVWAGGEINPEKENLQNLFNCTISGSIAYSESEITTTKEGIDVKAGKVTLGSFSVENFLGYLSGEGDYLDGFVTVESSKEKEADTSGLFKFGDKDLGGEGLEIKLPSPLDRVGIKVNLAANASVGGGIGATIRWGENTLTFEDGHFNIKGMASITGNIGLALDAFIASAGLDVSGNMIAGLDAGMNAETSFAVQNIQGKKKMQQVTDLTFGGKLNAKLDTGVALSGNMKFLFWEKQLFEVKKEKEGIIEAEVSLAGSKSKDKEGLTEGWEIKEGKAFFRALAKESVSQLRIEESNEQREERVDAILKDAGENAANAWEALGELTKRRNDVGIVIKEEEKKKLKPQIEKMKADAKKKIKRYQMALEKEKKCVAAAIERVRVEKAAEDKLKKENEEKAQEYDTFREKSVWGGFKDENYEKASPEMTSIDFIIYNVLGEVSENNYERIRKRISLETWEKMSDESKDEEYHYGTKFGTTESLDNDNLYYDSYHRTLGRKVTDLRSDSYLMTDKDYKKKKILNKQIENNARKKAELSKMIDEAEKEKETRINAIEEIGKKNNWNRETINTEIILKVQDPINVMKSQIKNLLGADRELESKIKDIFVDKFPEKYRSIISENAELTIKELLEIAVMDRYKDTIIGAEAQEKEQLLEACFHTKYKSEGGILNGGNSDAETASDSWRKGMEDTLRSRLKTKEDILKQEGVKLTQTQKSQTSDKITLDSLIKLTNKKRTDKLIASSDKRIAAIQKSIEEGEAEEKRLIDRSEEMDKKLADCETKLNALKDNAEKALTDKKMDAVAAATAINIYADDYLGKIKIESNTLNIEAETLEQKLKKAEAKP